MRSCGIEKTRKGRNISHILTVDRSNNHGLNRKSTAVLTHLDTNRLNMRQKATVNEQSLFKLRHNVLVVACVFGV